MTPDAYTAAIEHAVMTDDRATVSAIGLRLAESAEAMTILLAKGYGTSGMGLAALARLVPSDKPGE